MKKTAVMLVAAISLVTSSIAQITTIDTVTITAPDPNASEAGPDPGLFEIQRSGPTNFGLAVFVRVSGDGLDSGQTD